MGYFFFSIQVPHNPSTLYAPPSPAPYAPPPPNIYQPPKSEYNYEVPLINYKPQATYLPPDYSEHSLNNNYLSPEMYTPSIERYDNPDVSIYLIVVKFWSKSCKNNTKYQIFLLNPQQDKTY